ncbi:FT-interacting protein [Actinidia chinensis var. chinensis]|uniref:FT-interacting protein n=1 Tax=Actinidia chinensis var. chinensis TaxID=1590841 RepID=A0A2R6Q4M7_ACTCC|nr:FT-interacting protein [Actinidia chinensis var. chinensis]
MYRPPMEDFSLKETKPHLGGGKVTGDKLTSTYDLVEQMQYLYVRVVKAKDLPGKDVTGSCDPYVEIKLGNYKGTTRHFEKKSNPEWNQVFAFSKDRIQASVLEVTVKDKDFVKDDFIGRVLFDLNEVPKRVPPDSPLAPQWYRLEERNGNKAKGELMLAVWMGTQADEAFPEAWHSDAATVSGADEYMLDVGTHMWSMRRSKANFFRIMGVLGGLIAVGKWFDQICHWKNPITTVLIHILFLILVLYPELILPTIFLYLFLIGVWYYRWRPRHPPHMDTRLSCADNAHPDELDEEFDTFPTSRPNDHVRMRYDRLRSIAGRIQTVVGDLATQGERFQSLLSWRDPRATALFVIFCLVAAIVLYVTPFQVVALLAGFYVLRHPRFRHKLPSVPLNFFRRLPARTDCML